MSGIRIDQIHEEVFDKISQNVVKQTQESKDFVEKRLTELNVLNGVPDLSTLNHITDTNRKNLSLSGFSDIVRDLRPFNTGVQKNTGIWISNLMLNQNPFEPTTIDNSKRTVVIHGADINYTKGNLHKNYDKMMKLPTAQFLPVFYDDMNDLTTTFSPTIVTYHEVEITDPKRISQKLDEDGNPIFKEVTKTNPDGSTYVDNVPVYETETIITKELDIDPANGYPYHDVLFNCVTGDTTVTMNGSILTPTIDYTITADLIFNNPLVFSTDTNVGDVIYIKKLGATATLPSPKDTKLRLEQKTVNGTTSGMVVIAETLSGSEFHYIDEHVLVGNEVLDTNMIIKKGKRFFKYIGAQKTSTTIPLALLDNGTVSQAIKVEENNSLLWEQIVLNETEYERYKSTLTVYNAMAKSEIRCIANIMDWGRDPQGNIAPVKRNTTPIIAKVTTGGQVTVDLTSFGELDNSDIVVSCDLVIENVLDYMPYTGTSVTTIRFDLTRFNTVAKNDEPAMTYVEDFKIKHNRLFITKPIDVEDVFVITRKNAPEDELVITTSATTDGQDITVPFEIVRNSFDIIVPTVLQGNSYNWINATELPSGQSLKTNDIIFDDVAMKFFKYLGATLTVLPEVDVNTPNVRTDEYGKVVPVLDEVGQPTFTTTKKRIFNVTSDVTKWQNVTVPSVGFYRYNKTITVRNMKAGDEAVVALNVSGASELTTVTKKAVLTGDLTFTVPFNIDATDVLQTTFTVTKNKMSFVNETDYIQNGQHLQLSFIKKDTEFSIRRNDSFTLDKIAILERQDLVFIETWTEPVDATGYVFPFGNVQFGDEISDSVPTIPYDKNNNYCSSYTIDQSIYNWDKLSADDKEFTLDMFEKDTTVGRGWKFKELTHEQQAMIFENSNNNLFYDGAVLVQRRYRTRVVAADLFANHYTGTSEYLATNIRFQGMSPFTEIEETVLKGRTAAGADIVETYITKIGSKLVKATDPKSLLIKKGCDADDALFTVEEPTALSFDGFIYAIPVAMIQRRNQGVYHKEYNPNGTAFFVNGLEVKEDAQDFKDDISGFTLINKDGATLETASTGRNRKSKFKQMLVWLFRPSYKSGGTVVSKTTFRPDALLVDEINVADIIDLRVDANEQRRWLQTHDANLAKIEADNTAFQSQTETKFASTKDYINATAGVINAHMASLEAATNAFIVSTRDDLSTKINSTNDSLAALGDNTYSKNISDTLLIMGLNYLMDGITTAHPRTHDQVAAEVKKLGSLLGRPYHKNEIYDLMKKALKSVVSKTTLTNDILDSYIFDLPVQTTDTKDTEIFTRSEFIEFLVEGLELVNANRIVPRTNNWNWLATRYDDSWLGNREIKLEEDFIKTLSIPAVAKQISTDSIDNKGYFAGPKIWGDVHNYKAKYTTWIYVTVPFEIKNVMLNGDDSHALYINKERIAFNPFCCKDTPYSYNFSSIGWYRIDIMYSERSGGHYVNLGWNPKSYKWNFTTNTGNILYMTTDDQDEAVNRTQMIVDDWVDKKKVFTSTIVGDNSGVFTKFEAKTLLSETLQKINQDILNGTSIVTAGTFDTVLESDTSTFSILTDGAYTSEDNDKIRPLADDTGMYNKLETKEIIKGIIEIVNGLDSLDIAEIQKWASRLNISLVPAATLTSAQRSSWLVSHNAVENDISAKYNVNEIKQITKDAISFIYGVDSRLRFQIDDMMPQYFANFQPIDGSTYYTKAQFKTFLIGAMSHLCGITTATLDEIKTWITNYTLPA